MIRYITYININKTNNYLYFNKSCFVSLVTYSTDIKAYLKYEAIKYYFNSIFTTYLIILSKSKMIN